MSERLSVTFADWILTGVCVFLIGASVVLARVVEGEGSVVLVQVDGRTVYKMLLGETRRVEVQGSSGELTVETRDGKVAVISAACPNHICVKTGWRSRAGEVIVCVPNKTVVRILPDGEKTVRATTG